MKVAAPALPTTACPCALNGRFSPSRARLLMNACVMPPPLPVARAPDASGRGDPYTAEVASPSGRKGRFTLRAGSGERFGRDGENRVQVRCVVEPADGPSARTRAGGGEAGGQGDDLGDRRVVGAHEVERRSAGGERHALS